MADDFLEHIAPIQGGAPVGQPGESVAPHARPHAPRSIAGRIAAVHRRNPGGGDRDTGHLLDVTVGGDALTEIVVRVPPGVYERLEGKRVVMYIDD